MANALHNAAISRVMFGDQYSISRCVVPSLSTLPLSPKCAQKKEQFLHAETGVWR
ncbi:hypothetical protein JHK85_032870 [Glycine max]|nr:hypothetical protein JHK85_032870 [Glycine max]